MATVMPTARIDGPRRGGGSRTTGSAVRREHVVQRARQIHDWFVRFGTMPSGRRRPPDARGRGRPAVSVAAHRVRATSSRRSSRGILGAPGLCPQQPAAAGSARVRRRRPGAEGRRSYVVAARRRLADPPVRQRDMGGRRSARPRRMDRRTGLRRAGVGGQPRSGDGAGHRWATLAGMAQPARRRAFPHRRTRGRGRGDLLGGHTRVPRGSGPHTRGTRRAGPFRRRGALAWAAAAGFAAAASQSRIEELLRSEETFVEELFDDLLDALGSPAATPTAPPP